jgi:hypothetical protein
MERLSDALGTRINIHICENIYSIYLPNEEQIVS